MIIGWNRIRRRTMAFLPFALILCFLALLVWPTIVGIVDRWFKFDQAYSHGFLLLVVSIFLVVRSAMLSPVSPGFFPRWLAPFALALAVYALGEIMRVQALSELTIVPLILGGAAILLGWRQVRQFIIPIGILFLAVPVWDFLSWTLQITTVAINQFLLGLFDIDFTVEGIFVHLTDVGIFEVANGCSGLRYLLVGQLLALLYGELNLRRVSSRVSLYLVAVCLGLFANWIRVFVIIYVGYETNMQSSLIKEHDNFGWMVFAVTLVPLFFMGRVLEKRESNMADLDPPDEKPTSGLTARASTGKPATAVFSVALLSVLAWIAVPGVPKIKSADVVKHKVSFVSEERWLPLFTRSISSWTPSIKRPDRLTERSFVSREGLGANGEASVTLFLGLYSYDAQRAGHELVHYNNRLYEPSSYVVESVFDITSVNGVPMSGMTLKALNEDKLIHVAFGYYVEGSWENSELEAKLAQLPGMLNKRTDASLLVIGLDCSNCAPEELLSEISPRIRSEVEEYLDQLYVVAKE